MKFIPENGFVVGRTAISNPRSSIILGDQTKQTKFVYIDAVSESVKGFKVGDIVVAKEIENLYLANGAVWRPMVNPANIRIRATDVSPDDLLVQTENGQNYVPFESPSAAVSLGVSAK